MLRDSSASETEVLGGEVEEGHEDKLAKPRTAAGKTSMARPRRRLKKCWTMSIAGRYVRPKPRPVRRPMVR